MISEETYTLANGIKIPKLGPGTWFTGDNKSSQAVRDTVRLDCIDMMLIHSPQPWAEFQGTDPCFEGNRQVWRALEDAYKAGKLRAIGVSNFEEDMETLKQAERIKDYGEYSFFPVFGRTKK